VQRHNQIVSFERSQAVPTHVLGMLPSGRTAKLLEIGYVYDVIYPYVKGGVQKRVWELAKRLARNHEVHLFGMKYWDGAKDIVKDGLHLHGVCNPRRLYIKNRRSIDEALYFASRLLAPLLKRDLDLVDCQEAPYLPSFSSKLCSLARKNPLVITWYEVWGDYWYEYLGIKGVFGQIIEKLTVRLPKFIIPISERIKQDLLRFGVPEDLMRVVPNGVDFQKVQLVEPADEEFDVIYVGRLISHKNIDVLLSALSIVKGDIPDIRCGIIGDGPEMDRLKILSKEYRLLDNVRFFGFIESDEDVYSYMKSSKIFVLPSTREGFPNTILEANASHLPAIVVNDDKNAGVGVVKHGYNGYVINLSSQDLAKKIVCLLENKGLLTKLGRNSAEFAEQYDWNTIVARIEQVYEEAVICD